MSFWLSRSGIAKMVVAVLIVVFALAAAGISYYAATRPSLPSPSPTPAPSSLPTFSPTPTYTYSNATSPAPTPTATLAPTGSVSSAPTTSPVGQLKPEEVRDLVMSFIRSSHPETAQFMNDLAWTGGRVTPAGVVGAETYMYYCRGWNFTLNYPVVPKTRYSIMADYSSVSVGIPYRIIWQGTLQNEVIDEISYVFAQ